MIRLALALCVLAALAACGRLAEVGRAPEFTPLTGTYQHHAMYGGGVPQEAPPTGPASPASLWAGPEAAFFEDGRARNRGDILTVVIDIDSSGEFSATSGRSRSGSETMGIPSLFGIPQRLDARLPEGASMAEAVETQSASTFAGDGSTAREEELTLRVAAAVVEVLPNGTLHIEGQQEVRLNDELRELMVSGFVRPADISQENEVRYDRIAGARIAYGGRGIVSDVQTPRWGQEAADVLLPF
jgi:flagellar L-ring protein precursor FlgH